MITDALSLGYRDSREYVAWTAYTRKPFFRDGAGRQRLARILPRCFSRELRLSPENFIKVIRVIAGADGVMGA